ncbi:hypothetical protein SAMN04488544_3318 [Microlunatus sagamiharensis]|uniref:Secreted protein n=1 Tax=Microlunatus sagamiharensis TaxID=546874 RepID=A0A1H2N4L8_9ACTN|nr:hypothetical protein [Microlunatus sagamiharensis]SDV00437.1 hypothetical protein SAMN04488544_3318 [Microlunatus sagamiharensis]
MASTLKRLARLSLRLATCTVVASAAATGVVHSAEAATKLSPINVYSTDLGARGTFTITWYGANHAYVDWTNTDRKADGRGAYLEIESTAAGTGSDYTKGWATDHLTAGNGSTTYFHTDIVDSGGIKNLILTECNGMTGPFNSPDRCDHVTSKNPYA